MPSSGYLLGLRGRSLRLALLALVVAPSFTLYGYNQSGLGAISTLDSFISLSPAIDTLHTKGELKAQNETRRGAVIASFQLGALVGSISCLILGDTISRRKTIFLASIIVTIGQLLQVSAYGLAQFLVGRVTLGFGVGEISVVVPIWLAECSPASRRGRDVILAGVFLCFGYASCNWVDYAFFKLPVSSLQWRLPLTVSLPLSVCVALVVFLFPESPRWLIYKGNTVEAAKALSCLKDLPETSESIRLEVTQIQSALQASTETKSSIWHLMRNSKQEMLMYRFWLCFLTQLFQQICGGSLISVYASTIFQDNLHLGKDLSKILASCALTWKCLCCFLSVFAIDRWGRRTVFIVSGLGMSACMIGLAVSTSFSSSNRPASIASAFFMFLFNFFYPIGFLGANFLYTSEVAPLHLRVAMNSIATANHWLWNFAITMVTPVALETIGYRYYVVFAVTNASIPAAVYFLYPETMRRDLESLNGVFRDASSPWMAVSLAKALPTSGQVDEEITEEEVGKGHHSETEHR